MSGGHYEYASHDISNAVYKLKEHKGADARSEKCRKLLIKKLDKYQDLVHALEWYDSGDYGEDELKDLENQLKDLK